jgi:hypothetical protein
MNMDRKSFLDALVNKPLKGKKLFPDFPEGPRNLKGFQVARVRDEYEIYNYQTSPHGYYTSPFLRGMTVTIHSITSEGFIVHIDSIYSPCVGYLKSILGKNIIYFKHRYYLEGKEYPLERDQQYWYDEKTRNYYLYGEAPIAKEVIWDYSAKRKINKFLRDLEQAQNFYKQIIPKDVILKGTVYDDLKKLYGLYLKYGKEALADPNIVTLSIKRWKLEIYRDLGALNVIQRRVDP